MKSTFLLNKLEFPEKVKFNILDFLYKFVISNTKEIMRIAEKKDKIQVVNILTSAFIDVLIPNSINFVVKNDAKRPERLRSLMEFQFDMAIDLGYIFISDDSKGCILYINKWKSTLKRIILEIKLLFTVIGIENIFQVLKREKLINSYHPKEDFRHLWLMGVSPEAQGTGIGSTLLQETLNFYNGKLIYLETTTQENLKFYKKNGFTIFHETFELDYPLYFLKYV